jgi:hypothetical protein
MGGGSSNGSSPLGTNDLYPSIEEGLFVRLIKKKFFIKIKKRKLKKRKKAHYILFSYHVHHMIRAAVYS